MPFIVSGLHPFRFHHGSHSTTFGSGRGTEGRKIVCSEKKRSSLGKYCAVYFRPYPPVEALPNRITQWLAEQLVTVTAGSGIEARMELLVDHPDSVDGHIGG